MKRRRLAASITAMAACVTMLVSTQVTPARAALNAPDPPGSLVPGFGGGGKMSYDINGGEDETRAMAVQPDGKVVVVASTAVGGEFPHMRLDVLRFTPTGALDILFAGGVVTVIDNYLDNGGTYTFPAGLALQPDGGIVVAGVDFTDGVATTVVVRLTTLGFLDTTFNNGSGVVAGPVQSADSGALVVRTPDGHLVIAYGGDSGLFRLNPDGTLDDSFALTYQGDPFTAQSLLIDQAGRIVVGGKIGDFGDFAVRRYGPDGTSDPDWHNGGAFPIWNSHSGALGLAVDQQGRVVATGWAYNVSDDGQWVGQSAIVVVRFRDGVLDTSFSNDGVTYAAFCLCAPQQMFGQAVVVEPTGKIVVAGDGLEIGLLRLTPDGAPDPTFSGDGKVLIDFGFKESFVRALTLVGDKLFVGGWAGLNGDGDIALAEVQVGDPPAPPPPPPPPPHPARPGYWMVSQRGDVYAFGNAVQFGAAPVPAPDVARGITSTPSGNGYWVVTRSGGVYTFGDAPFLGASPLLGAGEEVTSLSATPSGGGYWLFTNTGRVVPYGRARFLGDMGGARLNGPVLGSVVTPSGNGYYMVASDGGIFSFGDAGFHGSMGSIRLNAPVVGLAADLDGSGYWLVASDGGIFSFDAPFRGSLGSVRLNQPVIGAVAYGNGYLMVASDGGIFNFSDKPFQGSLGSNPPPYPIVGVAPLAA